MQPTTTTGARKATAVTGPRLSTATAVLGALVVACGAGGAALEVGEPFPDLVLPSLDGGAPVSLADFRGQKLVLHVFASW